MEELKLIDNSYIDFIKIGIVYWTSLGVVSLKACHTSKYSIKSKSMVCDT